VSKSPERRCRGLRIGVEDGDLSLVISDETDGPHRSSHIPPD
jgi:hypothetical protein